MVYKIHWNLFFQRHFFYFTRNNKNPQKPESMECGDGDTGQPPGQRLHPTEVRQGNTGQQPGQTLHPTEMGHKVIRTSSDLRQLLSTQVITEEDLQILNLVGKGNVGCVYR